MISLGMKRLFLTLFFNMILIRSPWCSLIEFTATRSISPKHGDRGHLSPHVACHAAASAAQTRQSTVPTTTVKELAQAAKATMEVVQHQEMGIGMARDFYQKKEKDAKSGVLTNTSAEATPTAHCRLHPPPTTTCPHPPTRQHLPYQTLTYLHLQDWPELSEDALSREMAAREVELRVQRKASFACWWCFWCRQSERN